MAGGGEFPPFAACCGCIVLALVFALPLVSMLVSSFKTDDQIFGDLGSLSAFLPVGALSLDSYTGMFERVPRHGSC